MKSGPKKNITSSLGPVNSETLASETKILNEIAQRNVTFYVHIKLDWHSQLFTLLCFMYCEYSNLLQVEVFKSLDFMPVITFEAVAH